jgi:hypothetical protein
LSLNPLKNVTLIMASKFGSFRHNLANFNPSQNITNLEPVSTA